MGKRGSGEMKKVVEQGQGQGRRNQNSQDQTPHPYAFHVSGPRKLPSLNWRDLITSTWKDNNYKRIVMACFIQAVYLLELDSQENRTNENALAPNWWTPFKFKLAHTLIDERDGSIFGAILEWDRSSALADFILMRPNNAPRAVLAFRGTLLKSPTIRRDIEDDLRFLAWESLKGSIRFTSGLKALRSICEKYSSTNVCIAGHSLGAGFALQVGKALAKEGRYVEAHLFNPPSVSLSSSLKNIGERAGVLWKRVRAIAIRSQQSDQSANEVLMNLSGGKKWIPHLYVNDSDYICCYYTDSNSGGEERVSEKKNVKGMNASCGAAKMFVLRKGNQKFLEAHGLEQWWSDDLELQTALDNSKLISRQLESLYSLPPSEQSPGKGR